MLFVSIVVSVGKNRRHYFRSGPRKIMLPYFRLVSGQPTFESISIKHGTKIISTNLFLMPQCIREKLGLNCRTGEVKKNWTAGTTQDCSAHQPIISICIYKLSGFRRAWLNSVRKTNTIWGLQDVNNESTSVTSTLPQQNPFQPAFVI